MNKKIKFVNLTTKIINDNDNYEFINDNHKRVIEFNNLFNNNFNEELVKDKRSGIDYIENAVWDFVHDIIFYTKTDIIRKYLLEEYNCGQAQVAGHHTDNAFNLYTEFNDLNRFSFLINPDEWPFMVVYRVVSSLKEKGNGVYQAIFDNEGNLIGDINL